MQHPQQHSGIMAAGPEDVPEEDEFDLTEGYETASIKSTIVRLRPHKLTQSRMAVATSISEAGTREL
jgi:hypothetical protein